MAIEIYKNFFDHDCLEYIEDQIEKSKHGANLRTSYPSAAWDYIIIHESTPILIYDMSDPDILFKRLKEIIDMPDDVSFDLESVKKGEPLVHFMIYYWPMGSYIPWHNDHHVTFTATVYCNRFWNRDWGGLFLYEEGDNILAEVPEWNKLIIQRDKDWHSTTSVTKPYYRPGAVGGRDGYKLIPDIRTTMQIFMANQS